MNATRSRIIELQEYETSCFSQDDLPRTMGEALHFRFHDKIEVEPPSFRTENTWQLTPKGWVGFIPLSPEVGVRISPRVPLQNLFRMLEYAYGLRELYFQSTFRSESIEDFYEQLAAVLAKRVLRRSRQGFHKEYVPRTETASYIRGRLDMQDLVHAPWKVKHRCHYEDHTLDIEDNQILAWTLLTIARSRILDTYRRQTIRRAFRSLQGLVSMRWVSPEECSNRTYSRLNADYEPMHALCRFFLENSGPTHELGEKKMLPFLVPMPRLFELFVAQWLQQHLPAGYRISPQEHVSLGTDREIRFDIDLVLRDAISGKVHAVLDTKYKMPHQPSSDDVAQVVTYAQTKGTKKAILIYPQSLPRPADYSVGDTKVQSLPFPLHGDLEQQGHSFLQQLLHTVSPVETS